MRRLNRLASGGSRIDRSKQVSFCFDGKDYNGFAGDTLASALLANGVVLMGRSFKYHRPRGCLTAGSEEPNAIVELGKGAKREPNTRATMVEIFDGLEAKSQNRFPSLKFDIQSINQLLGPFLTAGFYYKTFMWPPSFWEPVYEKIIRKSAGLGRASTEADPDNYEHAHDHCDILVVGAGPTGISAALSAAQTGARVILVEEQAAFGGMVSPTDEKIDNIPAGEWIKESMAKLAAIGTATDNVTIMCRTTLFGCYDHNVFAALERVSEHEAEPKPAMVRQRLWTIRAKEVVLACGAHERTLTFDDNDRPGIMLSSAVRLFVERFGVLPGQHVVICTNNDDGYHTADILNARGIDIVMIADARSGISDAAQNAIDQGQTVKLNTIPKRAHGRLAVNAISLQSVDGEFFEKVPCDCVAISGGYSPDVNLISQTGIAPIWDEDLQGFIPPELSGTKRCAGACNGTFDLSACLYEGYEAGRAAAKATGFKLAKSTAPMVAHHPVAHDSVERIKSVWRCPGDGKAFVDFQNDVTDKDIFLAAQEGFISVEHVKRYTTLGMATDQGKTSNVNGIALLAKARGEPISDVGTTRFRPPYSPVAIGAFAGHERGLEFQPVRRTALHECGVRLGAVFIEAGQWLRPQYYPKPGEGIMEAIHRESKQVRKTAGICDVSTLGKIEIFGDDAGEFLNRLYINGWKMLALGKARYGLMLREDGYVFDDGTTSRLADDHYFMTTTTANAARVLAHMEHASQVLWPELDVYFCSATEQWCGVAVAGPNARKILADAFSEVVDVSHDGLPFMGVKTSEWNGVALRIFRISFSGELAFEVNVPWKSGEAMWEAIWQAGKAHGLIPYGSEALSVMRIEKGHVAGPELDGRTTAADMGLGKMMSSRKAFIGQKMAARDGMIAQDRATLVGLKLKEQSGRLRGGAHLVLDKDNANAETSLGWVTSVCDSPAIGQWIGLGYLKGGLAQFERQVLYAVNPLYNEAPMVEICSPHFFDPEGVRLNG